MRKALIGLDIGTTVCKAILVDESLGVIAQAEQYYPMINISSTEIEQDARLWWRVSLEVLHRLLADPSADSCHVAGLSVSAQGLSFVPVDKALRPLRNAFSWLDTRGEKQMRGVLQVVEEEELFRITGKRASSSYLLSKFLWFRENDPRLYSQTHKILMTLDFILAKLTGEPVTDHTMASGTLLYDIREQTWSETMMHKLGLEEDKLPKICWSGNPVSKINKRVAEQLGLSRDVVVSVGGQDQKVAALGAGIDLHTTTVSLGTALAISQRAQRPILDPGMRIPCFSDLFPGNWILEGSGTGTSGLDWIRQLLRPQMSYEELDRTAGVDRRKPLYFYPFFRGVGAPHYVKDVRGFLYGLDQAVDAGDIIRSVYEGIAFRIREIMELMTEVNHPVTGLRLFGGGSKSPIWPQIIADIAAKPVETLFTSETGSIGAAILAGIGSGVYSTAEQAVKHLRTKKTFKPGKQAGRVYNERFAEYREICSRMLSGAKHDDERRRDQ